MHVCRKCGTLHGPVSTSLDFKGNIQIMSLGILEEMTEIKISVKKQSQVIPFLIKKGLYSGGSKNVEELFGELDFAYSKDKWFYNLTSINRNTVDVDAFRIIVGLAPFIENCCFCRILWDYGSYGMIVFEDGKPYIFGGMPAVDILDEFKQSKQFWFDKLPARISEDEVSKADLWKAKAFLIARRCSVTIEDFAVKKSVSNSKKQDLANDLNMLRILHLSEGSPVSERDIVTEDKEKECKEEIWERAERIKQSMK